MELTLPDFWGGSYVLTREEDIDMAVADAVVAQLWQGQGAVVPQSRFDRVIAGQPFTVTPAMMMHIRSQIRVVPD